MRKMKMRNKEMKKLEMAEIVVAVALVADPTRSPALTRSQAVERVYRPAPMSTMSKALPTKPP